MILKALRKFYDTQPYPDAWLDPPVCLYGKMQQGKNAEQNWE